MSKVPQELIDEATRRGIVPGATICSPYGTRDFVAPTSDWSLNPHGSIEVGIVRAHGFNSEMNKWATVITPAQSIGLQEGDAVECGPAMRAAIVELAKELGLLTEFGGSSYQRFIRWLNHRNGQQFIVDSTHADGATMHAPEAFIAKMRVTAAQPKPIKIGDDIVRFNIGSIQVGCTTIDNATVRAIAEKLKD